MTPEEFDIDFDFDKEYGYIHNSGKNNAEDDDFDLDAALARELGADFDELFEKEYAAAQAVLNTEPVPEEKAAEAAPADGPDQPRLFTDFAEFDDDEDAEEASLDEDAADADMEALFAAAGTDQESAEEAGSAENENAPAEEPRFVRRERRPAKKGLDLGAMAEKIDLQGIGEKCAAAGAVIAHNAGNFVDALKECRPGHMDKKQKRRFKNDVLPVLIGGAAFVLCLVFIIGSVTRAIGSEERQAEALRESMAQAEQEAAAAAEIRNVLNTASIQAAGYDYQAAINTIDSYKTADRELTDEMAAARSQYAAAMTDLVVWDDPAAIPNLSFHVLIEDSVRAYADDSNAASYREKFVTTHQFSQILEQLYQNGYVLVNLDSCITENTGADGKITCTTKPIYLPSGKTPIMITETLVNYFNYMTDGDGDGAPDAQGAGFASRLVISGGEIKAEYIDADGQTHVGNYDLVPILDSFISAHPDFSYRGARAILAVTGDEGVFGWRTNTDASLADGARDVVEVLRANGYQIACNSFANLDYSGSTSIDQINNDMNQWATKIAPIVGDVDIMVIAKGSAIKTRGGGFTAMEAAGFRYIIDSTGTAGGELTSEYFHQHRVMVTGNNLDTDVYDAYFTLTD
ncbi:MAG: hypothetical protein IJZ39_08580 [Oscillospiraceae bacterium]|nr:hypothetical protein [Oscillospiraceae bacterium]